MHIGNVEIVWPGLFWVVPVVALLIAMPSLLLFALFKYIAMAKWKKIVLVPICVLGPFLSINIWPLILSLSGFIGVGTPAGERGKGYQGPGIIPDYFAIANLFGDYSIYLWTAITGLAVYVIFMTMRSRRIE